MCPTLVGRHLCEQLVDILSAIRKCYLKACVGFGAEWPHLKTLSLWALVPLILNASNNAYLKGLF